MLRNILLCSVLNANDYLKDNRVFIHILSACFEYLNIGRYTIAKHTCFFFIYLIYQRYHIEILHIYGTFFFLAVEQ